MREQKAFSDMTNEELHQIIVDVRDGKDLNYSNLDSALNELSKRRAR